VDVKGYDTNKIWKMFVRLSMHFCISAFFHGNMPQTTTGPMKMRVLLSRFQLDVKFGFSPINPAYIS
jgi:hypothetical protein